MFCLYASSLTFPGRGRYTVSYDGTDMDGLCRSHGARFGCRIVPYKSCGPARSRLSQLWSWYMVRNISPCLSSFFGKKELLDRGSFTVTLMNGYVLSSFNMVLYFGRCSLIRVALQYQRLQFRIGDNILKSGNVSDHLLNLLRLYCGCSENTGGHGSSD